MEAFLRKIGMGFLAPYSTWVIIALIVIAIILAIVLISKYSTRGVGLLSAGKAAKPSLTEKAAYKAQLKDIKRESRMDVKAAKRPWRFVEKDGQTVKATPAQIRANKKEARRNAKNK